MSVFNNGGDFVLYNDGRGYPFDTTGVTYTVNAAVTLSATNAGNLTSYAAQSSGAIVGYVVNFDTATAPTQLEIKLAI